MPVNSKSRFWSVHIVAVMVLGVVAMATPAFASTSTTTGGYSYTSGAYTVYACDTLDDGHQIEAQTHRASGATGFVRDSSGGGCQTASYGTDSIKEHRACRLMIFDQCGPWKKP